MSIKMIGEIKGCYGPRICVSVDTSKSLHEVLGVLSVWGGSTGTLTIDGIEYRVYEFLPEDFNNPLFKKLCKYYGIDI